MQTLNFDISGMAYGGCTGGDEMNLPDDAGVFYLFTLSPRSQRCRCWAVRRWWPSTR